jgi:hypothetical protein
MGATFKLMRNFGNCYYFFIIFLHNDLFNILSAKTSLVYKIASLFVPKLLISFVVWRHAYMSGIYMYDK